MAVPNVGEAGVDGAQVMMHVIRFKPSFVLSSRLSFVFRLKFPFTATMHDPPPPWRRNNMLSFSLRTL